MRGHIENIIAGESLSAFDAVFVHTDGKAYKADADTTASPAIGFVIAGAATDVNTQIAFDGVWDFETGLDQGQIAYLSTTAGGVTGTRPTNGQILGYAVNGGRFKIAIQPSFMPTSVKLYVANITQSGTDDPVAVVLENSLGVVPTWARFGLGQYTVTATGVFTSDKTALPDSRVFIGGEDQDEIAMTIWRRTSADALLMRIVKPQALESNIEMNSGLQGFTVEIRVYP